MPIYEYLCRTCNRVYGFLFATTTDSGQPTCPRCGATDLERQVSLFAFVRGGKDPLAALPKPEAEELASAETDSGDGRASGPPSAPERDPDLYRMDWDGSFAEIRRRKPL
jgi:putative FmdB family regulatory protein